MKHLPPLHQLARLVGGQVDGDHILVGLDVISCSPVGVIWLEGVGRPLTRLARLSDGPTAIADAYKARTEAVSA